MSPVKSMKKVVILTESQIKPLMDNLRVERDEKILSENEESRSIQNDFGMFEVEI